MQELKRSSGHDLWDEKGKAYQKTGGRCAHCGMKFSDIRESTIEHIIPCYKGGKDDEYNLTVLCSDCNQEKSNYIINPDFFCKYIKEEYREDYNDYFQEQLDQIRKYDIIQEDIAYVSAINVADPRYPRAQKLLNNKKTRKTGEQFIKACTYTFKIERAVPAEAEEISDFVDKIDANGGMIMNGSYFSNEMVIRRMAEEKCLYVIRGFGVDKAIKCVLGYRPILDMDMTTNAENEINKINAHTGLEFKYVTQIYAMKEYIEPLFEIIRDQIWAGLMARGIGIFELCHYDNWTYDECFTDVEAKLDGRECMIRIPKLTDKNMNIAEKYKQTGKKS